MTKEKAEMIYNVIDESKGFYTNDIYKPHRSRINILFRCQNDEGLEHLFVQEAKQNLLVDIENRYKPGIRVSLYNGVPYKGVEKLRDFMVWFRRKYS